MTDKRLLYRVILKVLGMVGIMALLLVFLNATFFSNIDTTEAVINADDTVLDLTRLAAGDHQVVRWNNQRVGVLKRLDDKQLSLIAQSTKAPAPNIESLDRHPWRSLDPRFFVHFDVGDSGHCPLFFHKRLDDIAFKDTCSSNWYDTQGRLKTNGVPGLDIPPHHITENDQLVIGRWLAE